MEEDLSVYVALREHILQKEGQIANETIYMYVTYFALLAIGSIWKNWMSLLPFVGLIVFQTMINEEEWEIGKASVYIKVFLKNNVMIFIGSHCMNIQSIHLCICQRFIEL